MDPSKCVNDLADALVFNESTAAECASDLLEWLESGGFMPCIQAVQDLEDVLGGDSLDERDSLCDRLRSIVEAS